MRCIVNSTVLQVTITELEPFTDYYLIVSSINNTGATANSNEISFKTNETGEKKTASFSLKTKSELCSIKLLIKVFS